MGTLNKVPLILGNPHFGVPRFAETTIHTLPQEASGPRFPAVPKGLGFRVKGLGSYFGSPKTCRNEICNQQGDMILRTTLGKLAMAISFYFTDASFGQVALLQNTSASGLGLYQCL